MTPTDPADDAQHGGPARSSPSRPRLVLLNGLPGSGKSTLARRFVDDHPLVLCLDVDLVRGLLGRWSQQPEQAGQAARRLALAMAHVSLGEGRDVVVPQFLGRIEFIEQLETVATEDAARFIEVALLNDLDHAARRLARRAAGPLTPTQRDAHDQLERHGGLSALPEMRTRLQQVLDQRPHTRLLAPAEGQVEQTYQALLREIG